MAWISKVTRGTGTSIVEPDMLIVDSEDEVVARYGNWTSVSDVNAVGSSYLQSLQNGAYLQLSFKGSALWVRFRLGPDCGKAKVTVDDDERYIDLYSDIHVFVYVNVAVGLSPDVAHTVKIEVTNTKSPSSTNYYVRVDSFAYRTAEQAISQWGVEYVDLINQINTINTINRIVTIENISGVGFVANISSIGLVETIRKIETVENVSSIGRIGVVENVSSIGLIQTLQEISKINPIDLFNKVKTLTLQVGENLVGALAIHGSNLYVGLGKSEGEIIKVDLTSFSEVARLKLTYGYISDLVVDGDYLYVAHNNTSPGKITRVDLTTFTEDSILTLDLGEDNIRNLIVSGDYLYAGTYTTPGKIVKIDLSTFSKVATLTLDSGENYIHAFEVFEPYYLYAGLYTSPGKIVEIDLDTFSKVSTLTLDSGEDYVADLVLAFRDSYPYLYAGCAAPIGRVVKIDVPNFTKVDSLVTQSVYSLSVHGNYLYAGTYTSPAEVVKIDLTTFTDVATLTFDVGEDKIRDTAVYGDCLYAGLYTSPGKIVKVTLVPLNVIIDGINEIGAIGEVGKLGSIVEPVIGKISGETVIAKISGETVDEVIPTVVRHGRVVVPSSVIDLSSGVVRSVVVKASTSNAGIIYMGGDSTISGGVTGLELEAGESIPIDIDNLNKVKLYASNSGDVVTYLGVY